MANRSDAEFDTRQFEAAFDQLMTKARTDTLVHLDWIGQEVTDRMRTNAPKGRTGRLEKSIGHEKGVDGRGPYVDVYVGEFYASFFEWNPLNRPFFRPALEILPRAFQRFRRLF